MDDARRFFRYLIPGNVFFVATALVVFGFWPDSVIHVVRDIALSGRTNGESALIIALSGLVSSGTAGYLLSMIHHAWSWESPHNYGAPDYVAAVVQWRKDELIEDVLTQKEKNQRVMQAWMIVTKLWHERIKTNETIESANDRANRNADLVHSVGACRLAVRAAMATSFFVFMYKFKVEFVQVRHFDFGLSKYMFLGVGAITAAASIWAACERSYRQVLEQSDDFVLRTLESVLNDEKAKAKTSGSSPAPSKT